MVLPVTGMIIAAAALMYISRLIEKLLNNKSSLSSCNFPKRESDHDTIRVPFSSSNIVRCLL